MTAHASSLPSRWAADQAARAASMWSGAEGDLGDAVRRMAPAVFPGAPPEAFIGFATNGARYGDTCAAGNRFHELGYFGTEGGPCDGGEGPAEGGEDNSYVALAADPVVVALLGRAAGTAPGAWRDVNEQTAVGLANLRRHLLAVAAQTGPALAPADAGSRWALGLAFMGWSAGDDRAAAHALRYANALAAVPEDQRWAAFVDLAARDAAAGTQPGAAGSHSNPAYSAMRTWQKLEAGRQLAVRTGGDVGWFDLGSAGDAAHEELLTRGAYREDPGGVALGAFQPPPARGPGALGVGLLLAGLGALGYLAWDYFER